MNIEALVVALILPLLALVVLAVIRQKVGEGKARFVGLILAAIIIFLGIIWRLLHGGF